MKHDSLGRTPERLKLRLAKAATDLDYLRPLSVELHAESRFADIPYSHQKRDAMLMRAVDNPDHYALFIAELRDRPVGFLFCSVGEYIVGTDHLLTTIFSFYVRRRDRGTLMGGKAAIRLLSSVIEWSKIRNSREIMIHVTSGIDIQRTDTFLKRANFQVIGGNYSFKLGSSKRS